MRQDVGEADETETPDDSDTTEGEPKEEEVTEENPAEDLPPVEEQPAEEEPAAPSEEEVIVPGTPEEPVADAGEIKVNNEIMAVTPSAEAVITVDSKSGGDADTAEVKWVGGCVDSDGKLATGKALRFRVVLKDGRKLTKVEAKVGETGEGKNPDVKDLTNASADADTIYELKWDQIETTKQVDGKDVKVGQPVQIVVTTEAQTYKITFAGSNAKIYAVAPVDADDAAKGNMKGVEVSAAVTGAAYDTAVTYVVEAEDGYKLSEVKVGDKPVTVGTTDLKESAAEDAQTKTYSTISIKPSDYRKAWDSEEFTVNVNAVAKATLEAKIKGDKIELSAGTSTADGAINYSKDNGNFGDAIVEGGLKETSVLAFGVKAAENYEIAGVTAVAKTEADAEGTAIPAADIVAGTEADGVTPYTVSLKSLVGFEENTTVTITVATAYTDEYAATNIHTVTFAGDLKKAKVTTGSGDALPKDNIVKVETKDGVEDLTINVTPAEGYELPKRGGTDDATKGDSVIDVTKQVKYETEETGKYGQAVTQTEKLKVDGGSATLVLVGADKNYEGGDADGAQEKNFIVTSATVTIKPVLAENDAEKSLYVKIDEALEGADYSVQYTEAGSDTYNDASLDDSLSEEVAGEEIMDHTWYIPEAAASVKVTVETDKVPEAALDGGEPLTKEEGDGYVYVIPAAILKTSDNGGSTLAITEAADPAEEAAVKVKMNAKEVELTAYEVGDSSMSKELGDLGEDGYYSLADASVGKSLSLTFTEVEGANFKGVSYKMGDKEGNVTPNKQGVALLEIEEVTGEVTVEVESESAYVVKLYDAGNELEKDKDGVYEADYTTQGIAIKLYQTKNKKDDVVFYDVVVKDGDATAETGATVADDGYSATLDEIHKSERGKVLTINVYKKDQAEPFIAQLRTNANSSEVRVVGGKTTAVVKDETVEMPLDAQMTFKVESVGASVSDLGVKLFKEDGTALTAAEQAWFADNGVVSLDESNGTFTITTTASRDARGKVEVRIYNTSEEVKQGETEKALEGAGTFKLDVKGYMADNDVTGITATPGTAGNTTVRINLNTTFKDKKNLPAPPETGDLYYKVVLDEITVDGELPANVTKITGAELTKYYKIDDYENPAQTVAIDLVNDTRAPEAKDDIANLMTVSIKEVVLVQSVLASPAKDDDYVVSRHAAAIKDKDKVLTTKKPLYETKLSVKAVNGAAVFTGQEGVKVATPVFGTNTGYDELTVQFVDTKTGVLNGTAGTDEKNKAASKEDGFEAWVDPQDNAIYVSATEGPATAADYKTLGVKVTANYPQTEIGDGYAATAVVKLNVKQGIYRIEADESKAKLPETIFVVPGSKGKNGSAKITPKYNGGYKEYKPAKAAVTWTIESESQNANIQKNLNAVNAKGKAAPTITVKNGTVTVTRDFMFGKTDAENTFTVTAKAADFTGNTEYEDFTFTVTDEQDRLEAGSIVIVNRSGEVQNASALKAEDFDVDLYVAALRNDVKKGKDSYTTDDFMPVTIASGSKANLEVGQPDQYGRAALTFKKPGTKLKINVNTVDGGKASKDVKVKDTLLVNIDPYENLGLYLTGADGSTYTPDPNETIQYAGGSNQMFTLDLRHYHTVGDHADSWQADSLYKNVKVKVDGGKFIANKYWAKNINEYKYTQYYSDMGTAVVVTSKDGKAKITLTDTANPNKESNSVIYNIENTSFEEASQKAPAIKLISPKKITNDALYNEDEGTYTNPILYQVTDKNVNYAGQYVKLAPDYTAANNMAEDLADENGFITFAKIDENGYFEWCPEVELEGGSYKMIATVCEMKRGEILPLAKDVKLNFSIPSEKKINTNLSVTAKYTLDAKSSSKAKIAVKTDDRLRYVVSEAKNVIKAKDQGMTKDTHTNEFTKYFEVEAVERGGKPVSYTIGLKDTLTAAEIDYITGNTEDKDLQKKAKEDCTGYITVSNGKYDRNNDFVAYNTKDIKVTIAFKENKYTVEGASIFAPKAETKVTVRLMNGKQPVSVVAAALDTEDTKSFAKEGGVKAVSLNEGRTGVIEITSNATAEAKKHDVVMRVVPVDSGFVQTAVWDNAQNKWNVAYVNKEGTTAYNEAELIAKYGVKVIAKIDVKAVDAKKVLKTNLKVTLGADNYERAATPGKMGEYVAYVPYDFVAGNTEIATAVLAKDKDNKDLNEIAGKTLITVAAKDGTDWITDDDGNQCIKISVSKEVLKEQAVKYADDKRAADVVTNYGAKLNVPVTLTYTNNGNTSETVTFSVTMPKKAMDFAEVQDVLNGAATVGTGKNAKNIKDEIEKMTTPQADRSSVILKGLLAKVSSKVNGTIPADADVVLTTDWSDMEWWNEDDDTAITKAQLNDGKTVSEADKETEADYDGIMTAGKAVVNLTLTNWAATGAGATAPVTYTLNELGVKHKVTADGTGIETDIASAIQSYLDTLKPTNDLKEKELLEEIWKLDGVKEYNSDRDSVNIWTADWHHVPATERKAGEFGVTVYVNEESYSASITEGNYKVIPRIKNIGDVAATLGDELDSTAVLQIVDDCSGIEAKIHDKILADAKAAIGNTNIDVAYKQREKAAETPGTRAAEMEDDFDYTAATASANGSVSFTLVMKSKASGRTVEYSLEVDSIPQANAAKYFDTADKAVAAVMKAVVTSDPEDESKKFDNLKQTLAGADNTQESVEKKVKAALADDALKTAIIGWTAENIVVDYTPAEPANNGGVAKPGKVTISADIVLTGDPGMKGSLKVTNAEVVEWKEAFQTVEQLKAAITAEAAKTIEVENASGLPEESALKNTINTLVGGLATGTDLSAAIDETADPAPTYTKDTTANTVKWENVKISIKKGAEEADSVTVTFNWAVKAASGTD